MKYESEDFGGTSVAQVHESFIDLPHEDRFSYYEEEEDRIQALRNEFSFSDLKELQEANEDEEYSWDDARTVASIEAAAYEMQYPQFVYRSQEFAACYRLLRTLELTGAHQRGGNILMIGSGETIHEMLGSYLKPPEEELVRKLFIDNESLDMKMKRFLIGDFGTPYPRLRLLNGTAVAIEPNIERFNRGKWLYNFMQIPNEKLHSKQITLGQALQESEGIPVIDTILWYRADPQIFSRSEDETVRKDDASSLLSQVFNHFSPSQGILLTVGTGDSDQGQRRRELLLHQMVSFSEANSFTVRHQNPLLFDSDIDQEWFNGQYGNIGCVKVQQSTIE